MYGPQSHPLLGILASAKQKPWVVGSKISTSTAASVTADLPAKARHAGLLCLMIVYHLGGTAAASTPTGFTSLQSTAASVNNPGMRVYYRFLDGTEAASFSITATSATNMVAYCFTIAGCISSRPPTVGTVVSAATTTPDPPSLTATSPYGGLLWFATFSQGGTGGSVSQYPIGFATYAVADMAVLNTGVAYENIEQATVNPSAFTLSASLLSRAQTISVRGA